MVYCFYFFFFFKQKTAYEMLRSLVGSEMCIRDRVSTQSTGRHSPLMPFAVENGGFLEFFLSTNDKREFVTWVEDLEDKSLSSLILNPLWNRMARLVPAELAPNVLALAGFLCVVQAWYLTIFSETHPHVVSACCVVLVCTFYCLHSMHTVHAMNTRQDTPLSELFGYVMDLLSGVFLALVLCTLLGANDKNTIDIQWFVVQAAQLLFLLKHLSAYSRGSSLRYGRIGGPGEALSVLIVAMMARATFGLDWVEHHVVDAIQWSAVTFRGITVTDEDISMIVHQGAESTYVAMLILVIVKVFTMDSAHRYRSFAQPCVHSCIPGAPSSHSCSASP
eukprot:TRINITY_DN5264_c0_g1_i1.p1 TRINITY_DN5264_c0_g1~~TRINITY_DN5264_c0_g1_i1.p1  ORF type:complete len:334 (-),score=82.86 TRINITY_DN5264_c0_g1_i1:1197-2198(-)